MDRKDIYHIIKACQEDFIQDLHNDVFLYLRENNFISDEEHKRFLSCTQRENRVHALLEFLPQKGESTFQPFVKYVEEWYPWIFSRHKKIEPTEEEKNNKHLTETLKQGGIPPVPKRHVPRMDILMELRNLLSLLERGKYIVLHGMRGCGKSTLVSEALKNYSLIFDEFSGNVFWVTCSVDELVLLTNLLQQCQLPLVENVAAATINLRKKFSEPRFKDSLLILDDVVSSSVIRAFDIGCKILVTTHDKDIMNGNSDNATYIRVSDGFTEQETLDLFKNAVDSNHLPNQAKRIHQICKGFPMTISLLTAQLEQHKEDVLRNPQRWDFYVDKLSKRRISDAIGHFDPRGSKALEHLWFAIGMCIDNLELKEYYQDFALFQDDVNVKPEVLVTLWGLPKKEVEDIMSQFENKSLVVRLWNRVLNSYVYSVHDLLLDYLKKQLTNKQKKELHLKLINQYKKKFIYPWLFPNDDNYMLLYLGYHLKEAGLFEEFPRVYLNLKFVERKVKVYGPGDLLVDYKKYRDLICNNEENKNKFDDYERFVNWAAIRMYKSSCDVVQFGLQEGKNSCVYKEAVKLAKQSDKKYFKFSTEPPEPPLYYHHSEEIVTAIFTLVDQNILISNSVGDIKLINVKQDKCLATYKGHTEKVNHLRLCPDKNIFLSASDDATVRVWKINELANAGKRRTPSPSCKQTEWLDPWIENRSRGEQSIMVLDKHRLPITDANFSSNNIQIVTASKDETVRIWTFTGKQLISDTILVKTGAVVASCCFNRDNTLVICGFKNGDILIVNTINGNEFARIKTEFEIQSLMLVPCGEQCTVLILNKNYVTVCEIGSAAAGNKSEIKGVRSMKPINHKRDENYICASISHDGKYVAIASTNYNIVICEIATGALDCQFFETNGLILNLAWSTRKHVIMAAHDNRTLKFCNLEHKGNLSKSTCLKSSIFDAVWLYDDGVEYTVAAAAGTTVNTIEILHSHLNNKYTVKHSDKTQINYMAVSPLNGDVIYCCENGVVYLIDMNASVDIVAARRLFRVECGTVSRLKVFIQNNSSLVITILSVSSRFQQRYLTSWIQSENDRYKGTIVSYGDGKDDIADFFYHCRLNTLFTVLNNHVYKMYNLVNGMNVSECSQQSDYEAVTFCDFFGTKTAWNICTGNNDYIILHRSDTHQPVIYSNNSGTPIDNPRVCSFSHTGNQLAIGCGNGDILILDVENSLNVLHVANYDVKPVIDIVWNPEDTCLLIVLDRDIILSPAYSSEYESHLYLHVNKVVPSHAFDKFVTVDSDGYLHIFNRSLR